MDFTTPDRSLHTPLTAGAKLSFSARADRHNDLARTLPFIVQELCESRGGRPGLSDLTSLMVSVDVKLYKSPGEIKRREVEMGSHSRWIVLLQP